MMVDAVWTDREQRKLKRRLKEAKLCYTASVEDIYFRAGWTGSDAYQGHLRYHVTASKVLSLASRAIKIFESSEVPEKRQLLSYLLQNPCLDGEKLLYELKSPFDTIVSLGDRPIGCPVLHAFRTLDWEQIRLELDEAIPLFEPGMLNVAA